MNACFSDEQRKIICTLLMLIVLITILGFIDWKKLKTCTCQICDTDRGIGGCSCGCHNKMCG